MTLLGEERELPYKRPPLSKEILAGSAEPAAARLRMEDDLDLELRLGQRATGLDLAAREVQVAGGPPARSTAWSSPPDRPRSTRGARCS